MLMGLACAASAQAASPPNAPASVPFQLEEGNIIVQVELAPGHGALPFIFDSGLSDGNIVSADTARALKLQPAAGGGVTVHDASASGGDAELTTIPSVRMGGVVLTDQVFAIIDLPDEVADRGEGQPPLGGFIGAPLLQDAVVCIDYRHKSMQRWARPAFTGKGLASVPMKFQHGLLTIRVNVDGRAATLAVDSGNNGGVQLFPSFADDALLRSQYPDLRVREGTSGSGETFRILSGFAKAVELAPGTVLHKVELSSMRQSFDPEWGIDGLAGFAFLSRLDPCLDRDGQRLLWKASTVDAR
jgi:hypothetical protein